MARPLQEIANLQDQNGGCPVLYAGDIFDRWNAGPEVINFALAHLPRGYAVPGQHDLPNHSYADIKRSAYWTLVEAGKLVNLPPGEPFTDPLWFDGLVLWGYPWGVEPVPHPGRRDDGDLHIAVIHAYAWCQSFGYPGASAETYVTAHSKRLVGYDVAHFGDNHKGFTIPGKRGGPYIFNAGGLMRRKMDERAYRPGVGLVHGDGTVHRHYLNTSEDRFAELSEAEEAIEKMLDMTEFMTELRGLGANDALDFVSAIKRFLNDNDVPNRTRQVILEATKDRHTR